MPSLDDPANDATRSPIVRTMRSALRARAVETALPFTTAAEVPRETPAGLAGAFTVVVVAGVATVVVLAGTDVAGTAVGADAELIDPKVMDG